MFLTQIGLVHVLTPVYHDPFLYNLASAQGSQGASSFENFQLILVFTFVISNVLSVNIIYIERPCSLGVKL
jgi:hypothetical protein